MLNVLRHLQPDGQFRVRAIARPDDCKQLAQYCDSCTPLPEGWVVATEQWRLSSAAAGCRLFHAMHYHVPLLRRGPIVVTIHDLTHFLDRILRQAPKSVFYAQPMIQWAAQRADHIITVSDYSRQNVCARLNVPFEKVSVIPSGVSGEFYPVPREQALARIQQICGFSGPYLLFIGNLQSHKNVDGLLRALSILHRQYRLEHKVLIVGKGAPHDERLLRELAERLGIAGEVVFVREVAQALLPVLYSGATATILPSFEEGFGFPVLESMACGTPVACSRRASLPEVGGDAVAYFDPFDSESMASVIAQLIASADQWQSCRRRALERAKLFKWEESARKHARVYREFLA